MINSIYDDYKNLELGDAVAIVPVKGFNISKKYTIGEINIYPINTKFNYITLYISINTSYFQLLYFLKLLLFQKKWTILNSISYY